MPAAVALPFIAKAALGLGISVAISAATGAFDKPKSQGGETRRTDRRLASRSSIAPRRYIYGEIRVSGTLIYQQTTAEGSDNELLHLVIALAGHPCDSFSKVWLGDELVGTVDGTGLVTSGKFAGDARIRVSLGGQTVADGVLVAAVPEWTHAHVGHGVTYVYVRLTYDNDGPEIYPSGIPTPSLLLRGNNEIYDPRSQTYKYAANAALCILDYLTKPYGYGADLETDVDLDSFIAGANISDELVALPTGGTQARYTCNGDFVRDEDRGAIMERLLSTCDGRLTKVGGVWRLAVAAPEIVTRAALTVDDLAGPIRVSARRPLVNLFNTVRGTFVSKNHNYSPIEFPEVTEATFVAQDNGEKLYKDVVFDFTDTEFEAQRIAQIMLKRHRQGISVEAPWKLTALDIATWDVVPLTLADFGWTDKAFRVAAWELTTSGIINQLFREEDSTIYDWDPDSVTEIDQAPDTDLPNPGFVEPPGSPSVVEEAYVSAGNAEAKTKAIMAWAPATTSYLLEYRPAFRPVTDPASDWNELTPTIGTCAEVLDVIAGVYEFRVIAVSGLGVRSQSANTIKTLGALLDVPSDIEAVELTLLGDSALLRWPKRPEIDVRYGGRIHIRHDRDTVSPDWTETRSVVVPVSGDQTEALVPALQGTYMLRPEDSSGVLAAGDAAITTNALGAMYWQTIIANTDEHTTFPGTKVDVSVATGVLSLDTVGDFSTWPDVGAVVSWNLETGVVPSGTYTWDANPVDLVSAHQGRVTVKTDSVTTGGGGNIGDRGLPIKQWRSFGGAGVGDAADIINYVRTTLDDPTGSPTWGEWQRVERTEFYAWGLEFKTEFSTNDPEYNIETDFLRATIEEIDSVSLP